MVLLKNYLVSVTLFVSVTLGFCKVLKTDGDYGAVHGLEPSDEETHPAEKIYFAPSCNCYKNGSGFCKVNKDTGEDECFCNPGYGIVESKMSLTCKECKCGRLYQKDNKGRNFSCVFKWGMFSNTKQCYCDAPGYYEKSGSCQECSCGQRYDGVPFNCSTSSAYFCKCGKGYKLMKQKCEQIDPCENNPCKNGGTCTMLSPTTFQCDCPSTHTGDDCTKTCNCNQNGFGICKVNKDTGENECFCNSGYGIDKSQISLTCKVCDCGRVSQTDNKGRNFSCVFKWGLFSNTKQCSCDAPGYHEKSGSCKACGCGQRYDGVLFNCTYSSSPYSCDCGKGYRQVQRQCEPSNVCILEPCQNKGFCKSSSNSDGFECKCQQGFGGKFCEIPTSECYTNPCRNGGTCGMLNTTEFECQCPSAYTGKLCEIMIDPCDEDPCRNGGTCKMLNATEFECQCLSTYTGKLCEIIGDICDSKPCLNNGHCVNTPQDNFRCECKKGFKGKQCEERVFDVCILKPCLNNGICMSTNDAIGFTCECEKEFRGMRCEIHVVDICASNPCLNNGHCVNTASEDFRCECQKGFEGKQCEERVFDVCSLKPCLNNGICVSTNDAIGFICECEKGFKGMQCETCDCHCRDEMK